MKHFLLLALILSFVNSKVFASNVYINFYSENIATDYREIARDIAMQFSKDKNSKFIKKHSLVALSIVDINNYSNTSDFGNIISENLKHEMKKQGYKLLEQKAIKHIVMDTSGSYLFSRTPKDFVKDLQVKYALTGTYAKYRDSVIINCRIIEIQSSEIVSTSQIILPKKFLRKLFKDTKKDGWFKK